MPTSSHHITIGSQTLKGVKHIGCFYDSSAQLESMFLPYLEEGLREDEQVCAFSRKGRTRTCGRISASAAWMSA